MSYGAEITLKNFGETANNFASYSLFISIWIDCEKNEQRMYEAGLFFEKILSIQTFCFFLFSSCPLIKKEPVEFFSQE